MVDFWKVFRGKGLNDSISRDYRKEYGVASTVD
jgi:hypothetical protein